jgi:hypothetical protein
VQESLNQFFIESQMGKKWRDRNRVEEILWIGYAERGKAKNTANILRVFFLLFFLLSKRKPVPQLAVPQMTFVGGF